MQRPTLPVGGVVEGSCPDFVCFKVIADSMNPLTAYTVEEMNDQSIEPYSGSRLGVQLRGIRITTWPEYHSLFKLKVHDKRHMGTYGGQTEQGLVRR